MEILKSIKTPKEIASATQGRRTAAGDAIRQLAIGATLPIRCDGDERRRIVALASQVSMRSKDYSLRTRYKDGILYIAKIARENGST